MTQPDPSIAPGTDPEADAVPADLSPRWVRYVGDVEQTVDQIGGWAAGEVKQVAGWLAERLLQHGLFVEAVAPTEGAGATGSESGEPASGPAKAPRKARPTTTDEAPAADAA